MIVQGITVDGSFIRLRHAPLLAAALRMFESANGGLPQWARDVLTETTAASDAANTSGAEVAELPHEPRSRILRDVSYIGTAAAAERLGISDRGVRDLCPRIEGAYLHGREWRIPADEIEKRRKARR